MATNRLPYNSKCDLGKASGYYVGDACQEPGGVGHPVRAPDQTDRLGRSLRELMDPVGDLEGREVGFR